MSDDIFRFHLKSDPVTYYTTSGGIVYQTTTKTRLDSIIDDWNKIQIAFKRSLVYYGVLREYSTPAKFVLEGARILRHVLYNGNFMSNIILYIEKLNPLLMKYEKWYEGDISFQGMLDEADYFQVSVKERGLIGLIKNRESIQYQIPLIGPDVVTGIMDGVKLGAQSRWILGDGAENSTDYPYIGYTTSSTLSATAGQVFQGRAIPTTSIGDDVQAGSFIVPRDQNLSGNSISPDVGNFSSAVTTALATASWYGAQFQGLLRMKVRLEAGSTSGTILYQAFLRVGVMDNVSITNPNGTRNTSKTVTLASSQTFGDSADTIINFNISGTVPVIDADSAIFLYVAYQLVSTGNFIGLNKKEWFYNDNSIINLNYEAKVNATNYLGLRQIDLFKRLILQMTDGQYTGDSYYLSDTDTSPAKRAINFDTSAYNTIATCGNALRQLDGSAIFTSLQELYQSMWAIYGLCLVIESDVVRLEPWDYCFSNDELFELTVIDKPQVALFEAKIFNALDIGYHPYDTSNVAGKNEYNTTLSFLVLDNDVIAQTEDSTSAYRPDIYGIESVRAQTIDQSKLDNKSDNDTFLVETNPVPQPTTGWYTLWRPTGGSVSITGVDDPSGVYNVALSPARCWGRKAGIYRSYVNTGTMQYQTIDKNSELQANLGSGLIIETADIDLNSNLYVGRDVSVKFKPLLISIKAEAPYNSTEILSSQSRGLIPFTYNGSRFKGWSMDAGCTPGTNDAYEYQLLCHPDNDMTKLNPYS